MFRQTSSVIFLLLIFTLSAGCQNGLGSSIPVTPDPPLPSTPTETIMPLEEQTVITVPSGKPEAIDGTISPGEWDRAAVKRFADSSELLLMHNEDDLYLAIRAKTSEMIVGSIFIDYGEEIVILHISAALGTGVYQRDSDHWQLTREFDWCCRSTAITEAAQAELDAFFQAERWVGTNSHIGTPNELEYQIEMAEENLRLAANFIRASETDVKIPWPADLNDDCIKPTPGGLPEHLQFSPDTWAKISIPLSE